jgi:hypothetical protein
VVGQAAGAAAGRAVGAALLGAFCRIYILNLPERTDRRQEIEEVLAGVGLSLAQPQVTLVAAVRPAAAGGFPTVGTRGCFEGHLGILRRIAEGAEPRALLLEDDADLTRALGPALATLMGQPWDMVFGHWAGDDPAPPRPCPGWVEARPQVEFRGAHFFAVGRPAAAALVPFLEAMQARPPGSPEGGPMHVDGAYNWFRAAHPERRTLCADPAVSLQRPSRTDIHPLPWLDRQAALRPLMALGRRAKRRLLRLRRG